MDVADAYPPEPDDDQPVVDVRPLSDVEALDHVYVVAEPVTEQPDDRPVPVGRPVVASTLTGAGVAGTAVAAGLAWSGGRNLPAIRDLSTGQPWLIWLLVAVAAAVLLGIVALVRPGRRVRWWGAVAAVAGAALSGWAIAGLPVDQPIGPGPGLSCVALLVLAVGQVLAASSRAVAPGWRWRPAAVAAAVVVAVLAGTAFVSAGLATARDVDATTAAGPLPTAAGTAPSTVDKKLWGRTARVFAVAGSVALVVGQTDRGGATLYGVSVLDLRTGGERWHHYELGWRVHDAALTQDGTTTFVVVDTAQGTDAIAFDTATGRMRWRERLATQVDCVAPRPGQIAPVGNCVGRLVVGDGLMYTDTAGHLTYLPARDGHAWPVLLGAGCRARGAGADGGGVYVMEQCVTAGFPEPHLLGEQVIAFGLDGHRRWTTPLDVVRGTVAGQLGPMIVVGDVVLAEQEERYVALATATGRQLWTTVDGFEPDTVVTDGTHLAWSTGVDVLTLDLHTGDQLWERHWHFPEEADLPVMAAGRLYLIRHTVGPNPYTCAEHAMLLTLDPATGAGLAPGSTLPDGAGNDCGPDVEDHTYLRGSLLVLVTAGTITVLTGH